MEHQYRRGIYRPKAQRLSISLAPLVAQRSLLFRVKADLATKTNYGELTPTEESDSAVTSESAAPSPALFVVTASASARIISAALSVLSTCSVYSQESWQGGPSPFAPVSAASPISVAAPTRPLTRAPAGLFLNVGDTRRHGVAFSPSLQWETLSDDATSETDSQHCTESGVEISSNPSPGVQQTLSVEISHAPEPRANLRAHLRLSTSSSILSPFFRGGSPTVSSEEQIPVNLLALDSDGEALPVIVSSKKRASAAKRISKHAKAFGKAMSHLSMQPINKKDSQIAKTSSRRQTTIAVAHPHLGEVTQERKESSHSENMPVRPRPPRSIRPPCNVEGSLSDATPIQAPRSISPPPAIAIPVMKGRGHRRYNSSPAVPHFGSTEFKGWNRTEMPPMPTLPPKSELAKFKLGSMPPPRPQRSLARVNSVGQGHVRAVSVDCL
ncbi:hypothetical protein JR316_0009893 [Psilocybe cubensis]|uniref:Uncharacterized protein n=2 Tax=Psilocybe cubensis TaxID=181762 RepID=A0ACB8GQG6_PSICU|nr:hypothetical protein JR316_0009893 [Psilocybe cubensis]KAH9477667.1 hypothetical protein JR316_0009893 [Psilocybe cubensis]